MVMGDDGNEGKSSRQRTRESGVFVRETPGSRSLERGLLLLRAFRGGITAVSNAEFASFSGLPRSTVSRLTRSLVDAGFLEYHVPTGTYRLGPPLLTLGTTARNSSPVLETALPMMRELADHWSINVGLAVEDAGDMVYLDSVRRGSLGLFRRVVPGTRIPVAETALGRTWLAVVGPERRTTALQSMSLRYGQQWPRLMCEIHLAMQHVERHGWCAANFRSAELTSVAMPICLKGARVHALNISFSASSHSSSIQELAAALLSTGRHLVESLDGRKS